MVSVLALALVRASGPAIGLVFARALARALWYRLQICSRLLLLLGAAAYFAERAADVLAAAADVNAATGCGWTPLYVAAQAAAGVACLGGRRGRSAGREAARRSRLGSSGGRRKAVLDERPSSRPRRPAHNAGLLVGQTVTHAEGVALEGRPLPAVLKEMQVGETVKLTVVSPPDGRDAESR